MKNMRFWRTALVATLVLTVMLSVTGGTIAWFTDEVTSSGNKIEAGTLDIQLFQMDKNNQWVDISESKAPLFTYTNWEPGYTTYQVLKIKNNGSLALKWKAHFANENGEIDKLAEAIDVYVNTAEPTAVPAGRETVEGWKLEGTLAQFIENIETVTVGTLAAGEEAWLSLGLKMRESAGNEYQGLTLGDFDVRVLATQLEAEQDSFGSDYDKDATYPYYVNSEADLTEALAKGGNVTLTGDIEATNSIELVDGTKLNLAGNKLTANLVVEDGVNVTISNGEMVNQNSENSAIESKGNLTLNNVQVASTRHGVRVEGGETVINGGFYKTSEFAGRTQHALNVSDGATVIVNGGTFVGPKGTAADSGAAVNVQADSTVIINGGNFSGGKVNTLAAKGNLIVKGGAFDQDPSAYVNEGYKVLGSNGTFVVVETENKTTAVATTDDEMDNAINDGKTEIVLGSGNYIIPDSAKGKTLTFVGNGDTVVATQDDGSYEGCDYSLDGSTVTFEGITINTDSTTYTGYARMKGTYKNCTINGTFTLYDDSVFENCTFNVTGDVYNIWTWGASNATFTNCTFNTSGKSILLYGGTNTKLTVTDCIFNDDNKYADVNNKAAIEVGTDWTTDTKEIIATNITVNGFDVTNKGISTGTTLWGNKNSMPIERLNVVVDGVDVY